MIGGMLASFALPAWAWTLVTLLSVVGYWLPPLLVPLLCPVRSLRAFEPTRQVGSRWKSIGFSVLIGAAALAVMYAETFPRRSFDKCHESYFSEAALMVREHRIPMVGEFMGELTIHLGPYFYDLLNAFQLVSPSPLMLFWAILLGFGVASALVERLGRGLLGQPWGAVAVLLIATNPRFVRTLIEPAHGGLVPLQLAAFAWCLVSFFQTRRAVALLLGSWCLAVATQMHGITVLFLAGTVVSFLLVRPRLRIWVWLAAVAEWFLLYSTWLKHYLDVRFADFFLMTKPHVYGESAQDRLDVLSHAFLGPLTLLGIVGLGLLAWAAFSKRLADDPDRSVYRALLWWLGISSGVAVFAAGQWEARYDLAFFPFAPLLLSAMLVLLRRWAKQVARIPGRLARFASVDALVLSVLMPLVAAGQGVDTVFETSVTGVLTFDEQRAVTRALRAMGYTVSDLAWRTHGTNWIPTSTARVYQSIITPDGPPSAAPGSHVYVADSCRRVSEAFSPRQVVLSPTNRPITVAPYTPRLAIDDVQIVADSRIAWESAALLPVTEEWGLTGQEWNLARMLPTLMPSAQRQAFFEQWRKEPASKLRIHATFSPGPDERVLVLTGFGKRPVTMRLNGVELAPIEDENPRDESYAKYYTLGNRAQPTDVELLLDNANRPMPIHIDLFEAPMPPCSQSAPHNPDRVFALFQTPSPALRLQNAAALKQVIRATK